MQKILSILAIVFYLLLSPAFVEAQNTLIFTYDENTQRLTVEVKRDDKMAFPFIRKGSTLSESLVIASKSSGAVHEIPDYPWIQINKETISIENASWFDSAQCKSLEVYLVNSNKLENGLKDIPKQTSCKVECNIIALTPQDAVATEGEVSNNPTGHPIWLYIIIAVLVVVAAAVLLVLLKNRQKAPQQPQTTIKSKDNSLEVVEVVDDSLVSGLDAVRLDAKSYYLMDMQKDYTDTAVKKIYLHHTAVKKMYDFFKKALESSDQTTETGCYFVGCWEYADKENQTYNISVEDIVEPGDDIVSEEFSFNFGLKIGVKLFAKISELTKRTNRDFVHTVWMHSHPGLGLFLSSHDLQVQGQLAYSDHPKRLVAFVIDTNTPEWDLAVFTAKTDVTMNNKDELTHLYSLEELYRWCRETHSSAGDTHGVITDAATEQQNEKKNMDDYYAVQVNHQESTKTINAYFSGRAINAIDDILYDCAGKQTIGGYVVGTNDSNGNICIDDCQREPNPQALGLFVVDKNATDQTITTEYVKGSQVLCVLVCRSEDELLMLTRNSDKEPFPPLADAEVCLIKPMKEWLRRRRVYK